MQTGRGSAKKKVETITLSRLVSEFGVPRKFVDKFFPNPILKPNPHYKCASPMRLYVLSDVKRKISRSKRLQTVIAEHSKSSERAKKAVDTKLNDMRKRIDESIRRIKVNVNVKNVEESAVRHYNKHKEDISIEFGHFDFEPVNLKTCTDRSFNERITVNFIRHCLTQYDSALFSVSGKTGVDMFYQEYRKAVLDRIAEAYPKYKDECERQKNRVVCEWM